MGAMSSIRLFVVEVASPPQRSFSVVPQRSTAPQPPGPGFGTQAPSVKISTAVTEPVMGSTLLTAARRTARATAPFGGVPDVVVGHRGGSGPPHRTGAGGVRAPARGPAGRRLPGG